MSDALAIMTSPSIAPSPSGWIGQVLGDSYRIMSRIGAGGMGDVYAAEHVRLGSKLAVKLLRSKGIQGLNRFRREARAMARVNSEFVVRVLDCGEAEDATPYLVMELLHGQDLRSLLDEAAPLPIPRAVSLILDACHGVAAAHRAGLVHRDLKPENLFVTRRATGEDWCKVLDFGIAKHEQSGSTSEGAIVGTVRYMAPEQLHDGSSAGSSVDIYSLGAVLYECLGGVSPHTGASIHELMFKAMNEEPANLVRLRSEVPVRLAGAVHRALAKEPADRFATVGDFVQSLEPFARHSAHRDPLADGVTVELDADVLRPRTASSRRVHWLILTACALSCCVGFAFQGWLEGPQRAASTAMGVMSPQPHRCSAEIDVVPATPTAASSAVTSSDPFARTGHVSPRTQPRLLREAARAAASVTPQSRFDSANPYAD